MISYPDDWKINKLETSGEISLNAPGASMFKTCMVKMEISKPLEGYEKFNIHELAEVETKMLKGQDGSLSLEILVSSFKNIKDHEWWTIKGRVTRKKEVYFTNSYKTIHNGKTYVLTYFSNENLFEKNADAAYQILESIDFLTKQEVLEHENKTESIPTSNNAPKAASDAGTLKTEKTKAGIKNSVKTEPIAATISKPLIKSKLSFAIPNRLILNEPCLVGKQPPGLGLLLIDQFENKTFYAKTGVFKTLQDDMGNKFGVTTLSKKVPDEFYPLIAILNPGEGKYAETDSQNVTDKGELARLNKLITDSNSIAKKFKQVVVPADSKAFVADIVKETLSAAKNGTLKAVRYQMGEVSCYVVEYNEHVQFLIINDKVWPLSRGIEFYYLNKAFSIGEERYVYFSGYALGPKCENVVACAFRIEANNAEKIFESCY